MDLTTRELTPEDADALAALMLRIQADHPTGFCLGAVEILEFMRDHPGAVFDGALDGPDLVGYTAMMTGTPTATGQTFRLFGDVDPEMLGAGIGTRLLSRALDRGRAIHAQAAPDVPARFSSTALAGRSDQADLLAGMGFRPERHSFVMVADLLESPDRRPIPDDVAVGPFDPATGEELRAAHLAAFANHPGFSGMSEEFWSMFVVTPAHARHALSAVARAADGSVAAYALAHEYTVPLSGGPGPEITVAYVGTVPEHRGRGLATGLLAHVLHLARDAGYPAASLGVDTENPTGALAIYERAGFRPSYRQDTHVLEE